jgi:hypothetical protein
MPSRKIKVVPLGKNQQPARLSPAQKKFNSLIQRIDTQKKILASWQETLPQCQQEIAGKLAPLRDTYGEHQAEMAALLDTLSATHKFTRNQQDKIAHLITSICEELITQHGREDLKPLYNRYSGWDFDESVQEGNEIAGELLKSMLEQEFGIKLEGCELDFSDPEGTRDRLEKMIEEQQRQTEEARPKRKKSAKQLAKEAREQEEEANASKSIQAVYRQLVAALHPDREPDPVERARKTELLQKVTVAYGNRDLLQLLELQLSAEQIDQGKINSLAEDRLKHYNKILQCQLEEIQEEVMATEMRLREMAGLAPYESLSPKRLLALLNKDIVALRNEISRIQHDLRLFRDVKQFKSWLKDYRISEPGFGPFF